MVPKYDLITTLCPTHSILIPDLILSIIFPNIFRRPVEIFYSIAETFLILSFMIAMFHKSSLIKSMQNNFFKILYAADTKSILQVLLELQYCFFKKRLVQEFHNLCNIMGLIFGINCSNL